MTLLTAFGRAVPMGSRRVGPAPTFVAESHKSFYLQGGVNDNTTFNLPTGIADGDLVLMVVSYLTFGDSVYPGLDGSGHGPAFTQFSGGTEPGGGWRKHLDLYRMIWHTGDPTVSTMRNGTFSDDAHVVALAYRNCDPTTPVLNFQPSVGDPASATMVAPAPAGPAPTGSHAPTDVRVFTRNDSSPENFGDPWSGAPWVTRYAANPQVYEPGPPGNYGPKLALAVDDKVGGYFPSTTIHPVSSAVTGTAALTATIILQGPLP